MKIATLFVIVIFIIPVSKGQANITKQDTTGCRENWQWKDLIKIRQGSVIFFEQPDFLCGRLANASVAIIKIDNGDTIRIICPCDVKNNNVPNRVSTGDKIIIKPVIRSKIDYIPIDPFCSTFLKTCYGRIVKASQ